MTEVDMLIAARARIADPRRWTQESYARDDTGIPVDADEELAVCWCSLGAMEAVVGRYGTAKAEAILELIVGNEYGSVALFNDHATTEHADVLAAFDKAIFAAPRF